VNEELNPGDIVMVLSAVRASHPQAGSVGTVDSVCSCHALFGLLGYAVAFEHHPRPVYCYHRRHLKKLEPPAEGETEETEREQGVSA
jgi:hypothetical protein